MSRRVRYPLFQRGLGGFSSTAQFMQADNYIQSPEDFISYNRYSYCLYNPFKYTDPSGETVTYGWNADGVWSMFCDDEFVWGDRPKPLVIQAISTIVPYISSIDSSPMEYTTNPIFYAEYGSPVILYGASGSSSSGIGFNGNGSSGVSSGTPPRKKQPTQIEKDIEAQRKAAEEARKEYVYKGDHILFFLFAHYKTGFGTPVHISTRALDFSNVRQSDFTYDDQGNPSVNLVNVNINETSVGLGKVGLKSLGHNKYKILRDKYDFNLEGSNLFSKRNFFTLLAGLVQGPVIHDIPMGTFPTNFSMPFYIYFDGTITIKP